MSVGRHFLGQVLRSEHDEISWAGMCPWRKTLAIGTDSGMFSVEPGKSLSRKVREDRLTIEATSEPVNDAAFLNDFVVVTSRSDIRVAKRHSQVAFNGVRRVNRRKSKLLDFGAHSVISIPSQEVFVTANGIDGMTFIRPDIEAVKISGFNLRQQNFPAYKLARIGKVNAGGYLIGVAGRRGGLMGMVIEDGGGRDKARSVKFKSIDFIDVASCHRPHSPRALIGLGSKGELVGVPDILGRQEPMTMRPQESLREAYSLVVIKDMAFILSDGKLMCLPELFIGSNERELFGPRAGNGFTVPVAASDMLPFGSNGFALLIEDECVIFDANEFVRSASSNEKTVRSSRRGPARRHSGAISLELDVRQENSRPETPLPTDYESGEEFPVEFANDREEELAFA